MCGIAGFATFRLATPDPAPARRMAAALAHRGPDDETITTRPGVALAFRRLAIIDPAGSRQPLANEDGTVLALCNGEIYNYQPLRTELASLGHRFATAGDAETVVHAYEQWGADFPTHLRGMFAIALWDAPHQRLLLVRDRVGIKPLHYAQHAGALWFASEIPALLAAGLPADPDLAALDRYLALLYVPAPDTAFRSIRKLPPATTLVADAHGLRLDSYWTPPPPESRPLTPADAAAELRTRLAESVRLHLQSDVPLAFFLSGGLDSSALVALAAAESATPPITFTVGFDAHSHDERPFARAVARHCHTAHHELSVEPDAATLLPELVARLGEPFADSSLIPTAAICRATAPHARVVVGGDGGDELFAGYAWTRRHRLVQRWNRLPRTARAAIRRALATRADAPGRLGALARFAADAAGTPLAGYARRTACLTPAAKARLYGPALRPFLADSAPLFAPCFDTFPDPLTAMNRADFAHYLPDDDLCKVDRATMACGLEGRVPFLDHPLVEFALALPMHLKLRGATTKAVLKDAVRDLLPPATLRQRKQGFAVPLHAWLRGPLHADARRLLADGRLVRERLVDRTALVALLDAHRAARTNAGHTLYALLVLELWWRLVLERPTAAPLPAGLRLADLA